MQRYFINEQVIDDEFVQITGEDRHHMINVMRMNAGDKVIICYPNGQSFLSQIEEFDETTVTCRKIEPLKEQKELPVHITIAQGLLKGDKLELVIQKGTELGMSSFIPLKLTRSVVKWDEKRENNKLSRYNKIAKGASEQSERNLIPTIYNAKTIKSIFDDFKFDHLLVASEKLARDEQEINAFQQTIKNIKSGDSVLVIFGPEGGFTDEELTYFESKGCLFIRLGKRILKAETAPLYVLASFSFCYEELEV